MLKMAPRRVFSPMMLPSLRLAATALFLNVAIADILLTSKQRTSTNTKQLDLQFLPAYHGPLPSHPSSIGNSSSSPQEETSKALPPVTQETSEALLPATGDQRSKNLSWDKTKNRLAQNGRR